jgi:hypothetical protein
MQPDTLFMHALGLMFVRQKDFLILGLAVPMGLESKVVAFPLWLVATYG